MIRRQFLPPEPANHPRSLLCEPVSQQATAKPYSSHRALGDSQAARHQHQYVITRPDAEYFFAIHHNDRHNETKTPPHCFLHLLAGGGLRNACE